MATNLFFFFSFPSCQERNPFFAFVVVWTWSYSVFQRFTSWCKVSNDWLKIHVDIASSRSSLSWGTAQSESGEQKIEREASSLVFKYAVFRDASQLAERLEEAKGDVDIGIHFISRSSAATLVRENET